MARMSHCTPTCKQQRNFTKQQDFQNLLVACQSLGLHLLPAGALGDYFKANIIFIALHMYACLDTLGEPLHEESTFSHVKSPIFFSLPVP